MCLMLAPIKWLADECLLLDQKVDCFTFDIRFVVDIMLHFCGNCVKSEICGVCCDQVLRFLTFFLFFALLNMLI